VLNFDGDSKENFSKKGTISNLEPRPYPGVKQKIGF